MKIVLIITLSLVSLIATSQSKELKKADGHFNKFNYKSAIKEYNAILKTGKHTYYSTLQIAKSYSKLGESQKAVEYFKKVIDYPEFDYNNYFLLARELQKERQYDEAEIYLEKYYAQNNSENQHAISDLKTYIETLKADSLRYKIDHLDFNSKYDEFGPTILEGKVVFSSNRPATGITKNKDIRTGESFYNLYAIKETELRNSKEVKPFSNNLNSRYNDGPISFDSNFNTAYLTRNTQSVDKKVNVLNLFIAYKHGKDWSRKVQPINLFSGNYNLAHAFIDSKNQLIYYSSDMPGGYGGMDLYVSRIKDGFLSKPVNLGPAINTIGNEMFPFMAEDGTLTFTSDGLPGLGGYDLFFAKSKEGKFAKAFNMGYPVNTSADDFCLFLDNTNSFGYFSSNRPGGNGGDDIYSVVINDPLDYCLIKGVVTNATDNTPIKDVWVDISNNKGGFKTRVITDENGEFSYYLSKSTTYTLLCRKKLFENEINTISPTMMKSSDEINVNIVLTEK
ncbi:hypothetical protein [Carboxylicivirga caseinilyticus]|uniref:hypothetical protein n=1 Tax=Carboxylicivirga caseinilyticus TaxID=3417572 RepID=UPI003D342418|nr:PD40 domain-containing protein [Marinilabiliaceae bacterium A049]